MDNLEDIILERIFKILHDVGIKSWVDCNKHIIVDTYYSKRRTNKPYGWQSGNHAWKSIDSFLFDSYKRPVPTYYEILNTNFYCSYSIFDLFSQFTDYANHAKNYKDFSPYAINYKHFCLCCEANKILSQICGDSLEEIAIKLDLLGV